MRCTLIVLDSLGVGAMPDAADWGDAGADTLGHILSTVKDIQLPNLTAMGLGNLHPASGLPAVAAPNGKPTTQMGITREPWSRLTARGIQVVLRQTDAKLC